jgi:transposase
MLTREDDVEIHALHKQGWTISAIARHLGKDRKTIRAYLAGERVAGERARSEPDPFDRFAVYCTERLREDPHLWGSALFDEVAALGYDRSYPTFTRQLRDRALRPACEPCKPAAGRPVGIIEHPPGAETQWDWLELPNPPTHWDGYGSKAFLLVGALSHSGKWRGVLAERADQPHLVDGLHRVAHALGGLTRSWRFDRMAAVVHPDSGRVSATFAAIAKHYGVTVALCPPRRGNRKGVVEKANHSAAQRWWRTLPDEITVLEAQHRLDVFCSAKTDARTRVVDETGTKRSVAELADSERLRPVPLTPFPALVMVERVVSPQALVAFRGNRYSVPPELVAATVNVTVRLGSEVLDIATRVGVVIARHRRAADGAGVTIRTEGHVTALNSAALAAFTTAPPHRRKQRIPPGPAALAAAEQLRGEPVRAEQTVIDLAAYAAAAQNRKTLP